MAPSRAAAPLTRFGEWDVDVRFSGAGALLATAYGILPVLKPDYAADLATHSGAVAAAPCCHQPTKLARTCR